MEKMFKPKGTLLALLIFLPITPSIAAITVFTRSVFNEKTEKFISISPNSKLIIEATRN